jgi:tRNA threonylcarbamoyladenosine biosynthesis protein TsaB
VRVLALETTGLSGSVAVLECGQLLATAPLDAARRSAQTLAPGIQNLLRRVGWRPADLRLVAVAAGPGSFTGLRIGVTTAKTLAYALGADLVAVNTLEVIAEQATMGASTLWCVLDAHRGQVFCDRFVRDESGTFSTSRGASIMDIDAWLGTLAPGDCVSGPILARLSERLPTGIEATPAETWSPSAGAVGRLAWRHYTAGKRDDPWQLTPLYLRASAAEEKRSGPSAKSFP